VESTDLKQREIVIRRGLADRIFRRAMAAGAILSLSVLALIASFLLFRGFEIFRDFGFSFITSAKWDTGSADGITPASFGIAAMLVGSIVTALIAITVALPFAICVALFLEYYAPNFIRKPLTAVLDLVAAIPSVIYGIWGYTILNNSAAGWAKSLNSWFDWIWFFKVPAPIFTRSPFIAGLLLALMILPITTSVTREVYSQAPRDQIDAAYGLGGTKWGAIRSVVMPFGRSGLVGGAMLGLGRALGETVAVYLVLNLVFKINLQILASAGGNVASLIATRFSEATPYELKGLMAAGLVLFLVTLAVNATATLIVNRARTTA
jgi:phosphate transport system permease protein